VTCLKNLCAGDNWVKLQDLSFLTWVVGPWKWKLEPRFILTAAPFGDRGHRQKSIWVVSSLFIIYKTYKIESISWKVSLQCNVRLSLSFSRNFSYRDCNPLMFGAYTGTAVEKSSYWLAHSFVILLTFQAQKVCGLFDVVFYHVVFSFMVNFFSSSCSMLSIVVLITWHFCPYARFPNSIFSKFPISNFIHWQSYGKLPIPMKYCRKRPEPTSQLGGQGAELWSPE
jgi:hypothetical protein